MTLTERPNLQAELIALGAILTIVAATSTGSARTARAETQARALDVGAASHDTTWPAPQNVSGSSDVDSETPALAITGGGIPHIVWEEGDRLYHSYRAGTSWSDPSPIPGAGDSEQPAVDVGSNGRLHLVYINDLDVFYVVWDGSVWSLPKNVSQTGEFGQVSDSPDIAVGSDGSIHVVVVEQTASGKQLHHASSENGSAWLVYVPIPSAYGAGPSIDVAGEDTLHVAYRDESEDDIYILDRTNTAWSLPQNVSNTPGAFSTAPDLAVGTSGTAEVVWQEMLAEANQIRYSRGQEWTPVVTLSSSATGAYLPSLAIDTFGYRHVAWDDEAFPFALRHTWTSDPGAWSDSEPIYAGSLPLEDVALWAARDGVVHAAWTEIQSGKGEILYANETFHDVFNVFLPVTVRGE